MKKFVSLILSFVIVLSIFSFPVIKTYADIIIYGGDSIILDTDDLQFHHDTNYYRFGITNDDEIVMAYNDNGILTDLFGTTKIKLGSYEDTDMLRAGDCASFQTKTVDGKPAISVLYATDTPLATNDKVETTYVFYDQFIKTTTQIIVSNQTYDIVDKVSEVALKCYETINSFDTNVASKWIYPTDNDFPYSDFDGLISTFDFDDFTGHTVLRDNQYIKYTRLQDVKTNTLHAIFTATKNINYTLVYDIVMQKKVTSADMMNRAIFIARDNDLAVQIKPLEEEEDHSTVFKGKSREFTFRVENIAGSDVTADISYEIKDYYNNVVKQETYDNTVVLAGQTLSELIDLNVTKYGMYWINISVESYKTDYHECYSFAFVSDYEYNNKETSPFGITAIHSTPDVESPILLADKIGVANTRFGISDVENVSAQHQAGALYNEKNIQLNGMNLYWTPPTSGTVYEQSILNNYSTFGQYIDSLEVGNENNMMYGINSGIGFQNYIDTIFMPAYRAVKQTSGAKLILSALAGPDTTWMDLLYQGGYWDKFDIISFHPYGFPHSPDSDYQYYWNTQYAMDILNQKLDQYGRKPIYVTEVGYPTVPDEKILVDLRTQADYLVRQFMVALEGGAERVQWYSFFDLGYGSTFDTSDNEFNFGAFYAPDVNDTIKPKPSAIAFTTMTQQLDEYKSCSKIAHTSSTIKEYKVNTKFGLAKVAWTTIEKQPNDNLENNTERKKIRPWQSNWAQSETANIYVGDSKHVVATDIMGNEEPLEVSASGYVTVTLTGSPLFIKEKIEDYDIENPQNNSQIYDFWKTDLGTVAGSLNVTTGNWRFKDMKLSDNTTYSYDYFEPAWGNYYLGHWRSGCSFSSKTIELFADGGASYEFIPDASGYVRILPSKLYANTAGSEAYSARIAVNGVTIWPKESTWKDFTYASNPLGNSIQIPELEAYISLGDVIAFEIKSNLTGSTSIKAGWNDITIIQKEGVNNQKRTYDYWKDTETLANKSGYTSAGTGGALTSQGNWTSTFKKNGEYFPAHWFVYDWGQYFYRDGGYGGFANMWDSIELAADVTASMQWEADADMDVTIESSAISLVQNSPSDEIYVQIYKNGQPLLSANPVTLNKTNYLEPNQYTTPQISVMVQDGDIIKFEVTGETGEASRLVWKNIKINEKMSFDYWNDTQGLANQSGYTSAGTGGALSPQGNWTSAFKKNDEYFSAHWFVYDWAQYFYKDGGYGGFANAWDLIETAADVTASMRWKADTDTDITIDSSVISLTGDCQSDQIYVQIYRNERPLLAATPIVLDKASYAVPNQYVTPKMSLKVKAGDVIKFEVCGETGEQARLVWSNIKIDEMKQQFSASDDVFSYMWKYQYSTNGGASYKDLDSYHEWGYLRANETNHLVGIGVKGGSLGLLCPSMLGGNTPSLISLAFKPPKAGSYKIDTAIAQAYWGNTKEANIRIMKNNTQIWPQSGWTELAAFDETSSNDAVEISEMIVSLTADDVIRFEATVPTNKGFTEGEASQVYWVPHLTLQ